MYRALAEGWKTPHESYVKEFMKERIIKWRRGPSVVREEKPLRINRARAIGYKAKRGFVVVRVRVRRGGMSKPRPSSGRRQKRMGALKYTVSKSLQQIAEEAVRKKYPNLEVLGSYWLWEDGQYKWFEVILVDPNHPNIANDKDVQRALGKFKAKAEKTSIKPIVKSPEGHMREGRGFSIGELKECDLSVTKARKLGIPVDEKRKTVYRENVELLKNFLREKTSES